MAVFALTSEFFSINAVDYSSSIKSATLVVDAADLDTTTMASAGWTEHLGGLKSGTITVEALDNVATATIDAQMWALLGTVVAFECRPTSAVVGANNPKYTGSLLVKSANIGGAVGELAKKSYTFPTSGAVTRAVA